MSALEADRQLDYAMLSALRGDDIEYEGPLDHVCPLCGPGRSEEFNRTRPVLRTWKPSPGFITYRCARCGTQGYAHAGADDMMGLRSDVVVLPPIKPRAMRGADLYYVNLVWDKATPVLPATVKAYFRWRGIPIEDVPPGALRFHPKCPWGGEKAPCLVARYSDAVTGEPRGLWRRLIVIGGGLTPKSLGSSGGCVIELWPRKQVGKRLVIGEGVETTLAAATRLTFRGKPLYPAWAMGSAGNMRRFPVLDGIEQLIVLVDNDESGTGQAAAEECAQRWREAGRNVVRLMPKTQGSDFNDLVRK